MKIASFIRQSLIDWEGKVASVVFLCGCNLRCGYCHNPSLVLPELIAKEPGIPEEEVFAFLAARRGWIDGVVVSGGEPTLHPELFGFLRAVKALGYPVKLDTNGTHPEVLERLIEEKLVDFVAMDIKHWPEERFYREISRNILPLQMEGIRRSVGILRRAPVGRLFRTTVVPGIHRKEELERLSGFFASDPYLRQEFRPAETVSDYL